MRFPAAIVMSVLVWSAAHYLPPYFLEMRRLDVEEQKLAIENLQKLQQVTTLRELTAQIKPQTPKTKAIPEQKLY